MHLKQFEAGLYSENKIIIRNPANDCFELFSQEQFEIVKFLKQNQSETLLALLLPNIGIAKKTHILVCLKVLAKLKKMQIVDYFSIIGKFPRSNTGTLELAPAKKKIELVGMKTFAAVVFNIFERAFSPLGLVGLNLIVFFLAAFSFLFFPFSQIESELAGFHFSYLNFFLIVYLVGCSVFSFRSFLQAAFIKACGREMKNRMIGFNLFFLSFKGETKEVWMTGFQSRVQLAILGLFSPLALSAIFTLFYKINLISSFVSFIGFVTCVGVSLLLLCPIFSFDMAEILHLVFYRDQLEENIFSKIKVFFSMQGELSRGIVFCVSYLLIWMFIWMDSIHGVWGLLSPQIVSDLFRAESVAYKISASALVVFFVFLFFAPICVLVLGLFLDKVSKNKKQLIVAREKIKDSLTFEERMSALEKIPLFSFLNDQQRLSLLNQMTVAYFDDGNFLVNQGEVGKEFLVLVKGRASANFTDHQGNVMHLASLGEGDAFGEIALIDDVPRTASIVSDGGCLVLVLKKEGFDLFAAGLGAPDRLKIMIRLASFFRRHPLFSKLNAKDQAALIDSFQFHTLMTGEEIVNAENDENFYVIYSGKVKVDTRDDSIETLLEADDCFGYANTLQARYFASEGTGLLSVPTGLFHTLIWEKLVEKPELFI